MGAEGEESPLYPKKKPIGSVEMSIKVIKQLPEGKVCIRFVGKNGRAILQMVTTVRDYEEAQRILAAAANS